MCIRDSLNCALLVTRALGLRSLEDFELLPSSPDADQPWIGDQLRDARGTAWTRLKVADLLNNPRFLDAAQS